MKRVRGSDEKEGVAQAPDESKSDLIFVDLSLIFSLTFSLSSPVMQEAEAWIENLPVGGSEDVRDKGKFAFRGVEIRADLLAHMIRENCVAELSLYYAQIQSSGLVVIFDALMNSGAITALRLESIAFGGTALRALATLMKRSNSIVDYYLGELNIQVDGVALIWDALAKNSVIEYLNLSLPGIEVEGIRGLARFLKANRCKSLALLELAANFIYDEGVVALAGGLKSNGSLRGLYVSDCDISDDGAIALASLLEHGSHLQTLDLRVNGIGEAGLMALANALKRNEHLQRFAFRTDPGLGGDGIENAFIDVFQSNVTLLKLQGIKSSEIKALLRRNKKKIPAAVRRAALLLIGTCRSNSFEGMGNFAVFPKDIVRLIAQTMWETRRDPIWIQAIK